MNRNSSRSFTHGATRTSLMASLFAAGALVGAAAPADASSYQLTDLTTDDNTFLTGLGLPAAANVDTNLINPWGVSHSATSPFWVSDNNSPGGGGDALYRGRGAAVTRGHDRPAGIPAARL